MTDARRELWQTASEEVGFTAKLLPGAVLLRRYFLPPTGESTALVARALQQSIYNEHPSRTPTLECLGLAVRLENIERNPFWPSAKNILFPGKGRVASLDAWGISTLDDLRRVVATSTFREQVRKDAMVGNNLFVLAREGAFAQESSPAAIRWGIIASLVGRGLE